jgi:anti-sigma B factor antagonist
MPCDFLMVQRYENIVLAKVMKERLLDPPTMTSLGEALIAECDRTARISLVIDLAEVGYLSSAMIGKLVAVHKAAKLGKGRVAIAGLKPALLQMFKVTQLDKLFEFAPDAEQVINAFRRKPL